MNRVSEIFANHDRPAQAPADVNIVKE